MDEKEINVALAEFMGWKKPNCNDGYYRYNAKKSITFIDEKLLSHYFTSDLNAMHEVEAELERRAKRMEYWVALVDSVGSDAPWAVLHATAAQRAQAAYEVITQHQRQEQEQKEG